MKFYSQTVSKTIWPIINLIYYKYITSRFLSLTFSTVAAKLDDEDADEDVREGNFHEK